MTSPFVTCFVTSWRCACSPLHCVPSPASKQTSIIKPPAGVSFFFSGQAGYQGIHRTSTHSKSGLRLWQGQRRHQGGALLLKPASTRHLISTNTGGHSRGDSRPHCRCFQIGPFQSCFREDQLFFEQGESISRSLKHDRSTASTLSRMHLARLFSNIPCF